MNGNRAHPYEATATSFDAGAWLIYPDRAFLPARTRAAIDFFTAAIRQL